MTMRTIREPRTGGSTSRAIAVLALVLATVAGALVSLAEEEGPLEDAVLRERKNRRERAPGAPADPVTEGARAR